MNKLKGKAKKAAARETIITAALRRMRPTFRMRNLRHRRGWGPNIGN